MWAHQFSDKLFYVKENVLLTNSPWQNQCWIKSTPPTHTQFYHSRVTYFDFDRCESDTEKKLYRWWCTLQLGYLYVIYHFRQCLNTCLVYRVDDELNFLVDQSWKSCLYQPVIALYISNCLSLLSPCISAILTHNNHNNNTRGFFFF